MATKYPSGAKFLAPGSKPLPKSYFDNLKEKPEKPAVKVTGTANAATRGKGLKMGKPFTDTQNMRPEAGSPQQNVMGGAMLQGSKMPLRKVKTKSGSPRMQS